MSATKGWNDNMNTTPEYGVDVLVYCGDGKYPSMFICHFSENRGWVTDSNVTHWQPLPEPPTSADALAPDGAQHRGGGV